METGLVLEIVSRKAGRGFAYDIVVDINGEEAKLGHGFNKPDFLEGDVIEFETEMNGRFENLIPESIVIVEEGNGGRQQARGGNRPRSGGGAGGRPGGGGRSGGARGAPQGRSGGRGGAPQGRGGSAPARGAGAAAGSRTATSAKDLYWERKEERDQRREATVGWVAAHNTAVSIVNGAVAAGAVALPKTKAEQWDAYMALVYETAEKLHERFDDLVDNPPFVDGEDDGQEPDPDQQYDDDIPE